MHNVYSVQAITFCGKLPAIGEAYKISVKDCSQVGSKRSMLIARNYNPSLHQYVRAKFFRALYDSL